MKDKFTPVPGSKYKLNMWGDNTWVEAISVGTTFFFAVNQFGEEGAYPIVDARSEWTEVILPDPIPEQFVNVYAEGVFPDRSTADAAAREGRLAVVHLFTDESRIDRVYLTRVSDVKDEDEDEETEADSVD